MSNENLTTSDVGNLCPSDAGLVLSASTLASDDVYNRLGDKLGSVKEIMLDIGSGKVAYVVMSFGGFLSLGEKLFAVPWSALKVDTEDKCFIFDVDEERLKNAPGFDKDHWPNMADNTWAKTIQSYYTTPYNTY